MREVLGVDVMHALKRSVLRLREVIENVGPDGQDGADAKRETAMLARWRREATVARTAGPRAAGLAQRRMALGLKDREPKRPRGRWYLGKLLS